MKKICKECKKTFEGRNNKMFCIAKCRSRFHAKARDWKKANFNRSSRLKIIKVLELDYDDSKKYDWDWINKMI